MSTSSIEREDRQDVHEFVLRIDGVRAGSLEFTRPEPGILRIEYVRSLRHCRARGLGRQLVAAAVAWAGP